MPAGRPKSVDNSKVFDVAKPSDSKPSENSRPVIANRNIVVKDQMITDANSGIEEVLLAPSVSRRLIKPITINDSSDEETQQKPESVTQVNSEVPLTDNSVVLAVTEDSEVADSIETPIAPKNEVPTEEVTVTQPETVAKVEPPTAPPVKKDFKRELRLEPSTESKVVSPDSAEKPEEKSQESADEGIKTDSTQDADQKAKAVETKPAGSDTAAVDAVADASVKSREDQKAAEEQIKRDAALQELIDSKKYVVPLAHDSTKKSRSSSGMVVLLLIVLILTGLYLAVDADIIKINIDLPFQFIK